MTKPTCETCRFYSGKNCHRYPPADWDIELTPECWCGGHEPKPPIVTENLI